MYSLASARRTGVVLKNTNALSESYLIRVKVVLIFMYSRVQVKCNYPFLKTCLVLLKSAFFRKKLLRFPVNAFTFVPVTKYVTFLYLPLVYSFLFRPYSVKSSCIMIFHCNQNIFRDGVTNRREYPFTSSLLDRPCGPQLNENSV